MPSKTFVPAFKAHVGEWEYYLCLMSYAQVAREINFAYELGVNKDLGSMIQRGIGVRTEQIRDYLLTNERRFLGALVVAAWGGEPQYLELVMADNDKQGVLDGVDREFGVLTFDGTHQFFALDGQHRLRAIKDALKKKPELGSEDIGVIVVPHFDNPEGRQLTRRLFTNINRNAVKTTKQEDIALDEDDGFAIITRRLLDEHPFIGQEGVVQVFSKTGDEGQLKLATRQVPVSQSAWTTIGVLYDILRELGDDLDGSMHKLTERATDEVLDQSYQILGTRLSQLLDASGNVTTRYASAISGKELRAPKGTEASGHAFMRPVVQMAVARAARHVVTQNLMTWEQAFDKLQTLDWKISGPPFSAVWQSTPGARTQGKMITGKESTDLLLNLLIVHLAPTTKAQIDRALKAFRQIRGTRYPITLEQLQEGIVITPAGPTAAPAPIAPPVALSTADRSEASTSAPEEGDEDDEA
jgi:DNA sulfur modification protein DndB